MAEEPSVGGGAFEGPRPSNSGGKVTASVGMRLDKSVAKQWMDTYDALTKKVKDLKKEINQLNNAANRTTQAVQGRLAAGGATNPSTTSASATSGAIATTAALAGKGGGGGGGGIMAAAGAAGGGGAGGGLSGALMMSGNPYIAAGAAAIKTINAFRDSVSKQLATLDARIERNYDRSLEADRLAVLYQQTRGVSQQQYYDRFRKPLQQYRLGVGGINTLLGLQATTGLNAQKMAPGVEAFRTITGYGMSTADVASMLQNMASPEVNNRMTMTMGTGLYGPGGVQRNPMAVMQQIVKATGLTNERVLAGAQQQGSMTRARLSAMGVPPEMQDLVIQYAMENLQFQKRTGGTQGMYDPSNRQQMRIMGIDKNFATEREVTDTRRELREESFYNKQKGAFATNERNLQAMTDLTKKIEELTAAIIGARISTKNNPIVRGLSKGFGSAFRMFDILGDPVERGVGSRATASGGARPRSSGGDHGLHSTFAERLNRLMAERPSITINGGYRSAADQRTMFLSRYSKTSEDTGIYWNGSFWKKTSSAPDAAPPGMSMHELGLAADMHLPTKEDEAWLVQNAARFGLKTFADVINEPWHVQPAELPNSRRDYEKAGAPWGRPAGATQFDATARFDGKMGGTTDSVSRVIMTTSQMSLADSLALAREGTLMALGGGASGRMVAVRGRRVVTREDISGRGTSTVPSSSQIPAGFKFRTTPSYGGWGYYVPTNFTDADLEALHLHEQKDWTRVVKNADGTLMGGFAMNQYNWDRAGGKRFAKSPHLATPEQQKQVAKYLLDELNAHNGFESIVRGNVAWPGAGKLKSIDLPANVGTSTTYGPSGDPLIPSKSTGATVVVEGSGGGITIAPNIYIQSGGNTTADAQRAAEEVANIVTRRLKSATLRSM